MRTSPGVALLGVVLTAALSPAIAGATTVIPQAVKPQVVQPQTVTPVQAPASDPRPAPAPLPSPAAPPAPTQSAGSPSGTSPSGDSAGTDIVPQPRPSRRVPADPNHLSPHEIELLDRAIREGEEAERRQKLDGAPTTNPHSEKVSISPAQIFAAQLLLQALGFNAFGIDPFSPPLPNDPTPIPTGSVEVTETPVELDGRAGPKSSSGADTPPPGHDADDISDWDNLNPFAPQAPVEPGDAPPAGGGGFFDEFLPFLAE